MTPNQKAFIKGLQGDHSEAPYRTFERFCEMAFCALAKPLASPERGAVLEARYLRLVAQVGQERTLAFSQMLGMVAEDVCGSGADFLGTVFMSDEVRANNRDAGQFFTPMEVSRMMAAMVLRDAKAEFGDKPYITMAEPACGSGGMVLAAAAELRSQGFDLATQVWFEATDISPLCFHMALIQMSLFGCAGIVRCDDTLCPREQAEWAVTIRSAPFLLRHGWPGSEREPDVVPVLGQPSLFEDSPFPGLPRHLSDQGATS